MRTCGTAEPENQLGEGCLVDQLAGQYMAHVTGLGYVHDPAKLKTTQQSILKYTRKSRFTDHSNCMLRYVLDDETALLLAAYPGERPRSPFPYFAEAMTAFEWVVAVGMLYDATVGEGLDCCDSVIRARYHGCHRNPYDAAECAHRYARAMAVWRTCDLDLDRWTRTSGRFRAAGEG